MLSCECKDVEGLETFIKSSDIDISGDEIKCILSGFYCKKCRKKLKSEGLLFKNEAEAEKWLQK